MVIQGLTKQKIYISTQMSIKALLGNLAKGHLTFHFVVPATSCNFFLFKKNIKCYDILISFTILGMVNTLLNALLNDGFTEF